MGGDRDGNPFVTPETTREVVLTARMAAISEYERSVEKLMYELSVWRCNDELQARPKGVLRVASPECGSANTTPTMLRVLRLLRVALQREQQVRPEVIRGPC